MKVGLLGLLQCSSLVAEVPPAVCEHSSPVPVVYNLQTGSAQNPSQGSDLNFLYDIKKKGLSGVIFL